MDADEREIFQYLKSWGADFVNATEVCRRAGGKRRFSENPDWAKPVLVLMHERGILEKDGVGRYRIKPLPKKKETRWVSPDIAKILQESGVKSDETGNLATGIANDEYYEQL